MDAELAKTMSVLFQDTFEQAGLPWKVVAGTGVATRTVVDGEWATKGAAMKLTTSTVVSEVCRLARFEGKQQGSRRYAFGGRFAVMDENVATLEFRFGFRDGVNYQRALFRHTYPTDLWQYDSGGAGAQNLVTLTTRDPQDAVGQARWHDFVIVGVFDKYLHERIRLDDQDFSNPVSGVALKSSADATIANEFEFSVETTNVGAAPVAGVVLLDELYCLYSA